MAWSQKAREAAAAARRKRAANNTGGFSSERRGFGVPGAKLAPKRLGTLVDSGRVSKKASSRQTKVEHTLNKTQSHAMFLNRKGKTLSALGRSSQAPRLERKLASAVTNRQKIGAWKSPHTYSLPKGTPVSRRLGVHNGNSQYVVSKMYSSRRK